MKTILLVDDEYVIVEILAKLLAEEGFVTVTASNGQEALESLRRKVPDLVITDLMMPVLGGAELFRAMRKDPSYRKIPVVLMSAAPLVPPYDDLPWASFLRKPFEFVQLTKWLRRHFRGDRVKPGR